MSTQFTWIDIYHEIAQTLLGWQEKQGELIAFLERLRDQGYFVTPINDRNSEGERFLLQEIDPFTFIASINRGIRDEQRLAILAQMKQFFNLQSPLPSDFASIPVVNNQSSWFFDYQPARGPDDIAKLWRVFRLAMSENPHDNPDFWQAFDDALTVRRTNINLTMGLFWIRPYDFLSLDSLNRTYLKITMPKKGLDAQFYRSFLQSVSAQGKPFPQISLEAWLSVGSLASAAQSPQLIERPKDIQYWLVGAYWDSAEPKDQTQRFLDEGIWQNNYNDKYLEEVKSMKVGDKIGIKTSFTQRRGLPFDHHGRTVSGMTIKAIGTIVANRNDGRTVEVEWDTDFQEKKWYFYTARITVWHVGAKNTWKEAADQLIDFVWYGKEQDYDWFCQQWFRSDAGPERKDLPEPISPAYSVEDILAAGVFMNAEEVEEILDRIRVKKAVILQGAPGVGKTFLAKKLAYALLEEVDDERVEMVQFHQSYSYEDFVRGYRPVAGQAGSFALQNGIFYDFCQKAAADPDRPYGFIIDEINRGNLSQIFGELLMLIEGDKRGREHAVPLVYRGPDEPRFFIPSNLYLIGLMNIADRSLAMVDYALRRRFAFITLQPQYESQLFRDWLLKREMDPNLAQRIIERLSVLNRIIRDDPLLGENYQIGHSYFCPKGEDFSALTADWFRSIVRTEIVPLLKEYWFDNPTKADEAEKMLLAE
ncbi:MAG: AAA family ATPase [Chloroflexota bacterium]